MSQLLICLLPFLLAAPYEVPPGPPLPGLKPEEQARLERALLALRTDAPQEIERACRELALLGNCALPAVVARLNEAGPGERMLLLSALRRLPLAAPLLAEAARDAHPAVRALVATPPRRREAPDLRRLAAEYLDLLDVAGHRDRSEAAEDLKGLTPPLGHDESTFENLRRRLSDRRLADLYQAQRNEVAVRFARAGAVALANGSLAPDLADPTFVAYLALLREDESSPLYYALAGLSSLGERGFDRLEPLLHRPQHDPRRIVPLLMALRADRGRALFERAAFDRFPPATQAALVSWSARTLAPEERTPWLEGVARTEESTVRARALEELLTLPAPAGADVAEELFDPERESHTLYGEQARLLARAGRIDRLAEFVRLRTPLAGAGESATRVSHARRTSIAALRKEGGPGAEKLGAELLKEASPELRLLGIDLVRERELLLAHLEQEKEAPLIELATLRLLELHALSVEAALADALSRKSFPLTRRVAQAFARAGAVGALVAFAEAGETNAFDALAGLELIDAVFEERLLAMHDAATENEQKRRTLAALLALRSDAVRERVLAAGDEGITLLGIRAELDGTLRFSIPLRERVATADPLELHRLGRIAAALPEPEPGIILALMERWEELALSDPGGADTEGGPARQRIRLAESLPRARDSQSVRVLFARLLTGEMLDPQLVLPTLHAAARHLSAEELAPLFGVLQARLIEERPLGEHPVGERQPPPYDDLRRRLLWGSINALALRPPEGTAEFLCTILLDPAIQPSAYDWKESCPAPRWALEALRHLPAAQVREALTLVLAGAEARGELSAMHPQTLFSYVRSCRDGRDRGRSLAEVALLLCDLLERVPGDRVDREIELQRTTALATEARWAEAAESSSKAAAQGRDRAQSEDEEFWSPRKLELRARIYDAVGKGDKDALRAVLAGEAPDPIVAYLVGWNLLFYAPDLPSAAEAAAIATWGTGGLYHDYRDLLGMARVMEGKHSEALWWFDPDSALAVRRPTDQSARYLLFQAKAYLALGERRAATGDLERALREDRRIVPWARNDSDFASFKESFASAEEEFYDWLFRWE